MRWVAVGAAAGLVLAAAVVRFVLSLIARMYSGDIE